MYLVRLRGDVIQPKLKLYKRVLKLMVQRGADGTNYFANYF